VTGSVTPSDLPDYGQLVKFLFQPFLSVADDTLAPSDAERGKSLGEGLSVDCEYTIDRHRVWIRVAVASADQGSAFGRGGRNIQAIRTVLQAAATAVGQSIVLDVYGNTSGSRSEQTDRSERSGKPSVAGSEGSATRPPRSMPTRRAATSGDRPNDNSSPPPPRPRR
jgi:uncharacterized protein